MFGKSNWKEMAEALNAISSPQWPPITPTEGVKGRALQMSLDARRDGEMPTETVDRAKVFEAYLKGE